MGIHLTNLLGRMGDTDEGAYELSSDEEVENILRPPKCRVERTTPCVISKRTLMFLTQTPTDNNHRKRTKQIHTDQQCQTETKSTLALLPLTTDRRTGKATPDTGKYPHTNTCHRHTPTTNQTTQTHRKPTTGHIIARSRIMDTLNPHWEGDRNDQCQACDAVDTLTECTRCNIVWHASCLQPPLPFPLRKQDAIVCGDACWAELIDEFTRRDAPEPVKEDPLVTPILLPRRHSNTTPTEHNYPSVTSRTPQGGRLDSNTTSERGQDGATPTTDTTTRGRKRRAREQRKGKKKKPRLWAHINLWTINNSQ